MHVSRGAARLQRLCTTPVTQRAMAALAGQGGDGERRVAVVGGGIAGLFCASTLARFGYSVTVFDMGKSAPGERPLHAQQ